MSATKLTKQFPGRHVVRCTVWTPDAKKPGEWATRFGFEGMLPKAVAEFFYLAAFAAAGKRITPEQEERIDALNREFRNSPDKVKGIESK